MVEAAILEDVVAKIMVVTNSVGGGRQVGTTAAQLGRGNGQTGDIAHCYASPGGLKQRHLMLLS